MRTNYQLGLGLLLVGALLGSGCGSDRKRAPVVEDPLATRTGFCEEWGAKACSDPVREACLAASKEACIAKQADYCLLLVKPDYAPDNAKTCLEAVGAAYSDAKLTAQEYEIVINLGAPCNKLIAGPGQSGSSCRETWECNTLDDLVCIIREGATIGTCEVPVVQGGGLSCVELFQKCAPGFYCNGSNCIVGKAEGEPCSAAEPCGLDLNCAVASATCEPKGRATDPCENDNDCATKICAKTGTTNAGVCAPQIVLGPADPLCANLR